MLLKNLDVIKKQLDRGVKRSEIDRFIAQCSQSASILDVNLERATEIVSVFKRVAVSDADPTMRRLDVRSLVENAVLSLKPTLNAHGIGVDYSAVDVGLTRMGQSGLLTQVFVNLIQNSIIHGYPQGKTGCISIVSTKMSESLVELVFEDDGVGIPAEVVPLVFDPFFTTKRDQGGSGIGMHLAKKTLDELYGASIEAGHAKDGGARFRIVLPLS